MHGRDKLLEAVGLTYEAGLGDRPWSDALERVAGLTGSRSAVVQAIDLAARTLVQFEHVRVPAESAQEYNRRFAELDPYLDRSLQNRLGGIFTDHDLMSECEMGRGEAYAGFLASHGWPHFATGGFLVEAGLLGQFTILRGRHEGPVDQTALNLVRTFLPHVERALRLQWRMNLIEDRAEIVDRLPIGTILVASGGRVLSMNRAAQQVIAENDGLTITEQRLCAAYKRDTEKLHRLIAAACRATKEAFHAGGPLSILRPSTKRPYRLLIAPIRAHDRGEDYASISTTVCVFVVGWEGPADPPVETFRRLYGLTRAETRIADQLMRGEGLPGAADALGMARETARSHLKHIFRKTDTHSQAELVRLLLSLPFMAVAPDDPQRDPD